MRRAHGPICVAALAALSACSEKPSLGIAEKARFTAELIDGRRECRQYSERLTVPVVDNSVIDQTYRAAKAAHCLKPDV